MKRNPFARIAACILAAVAITTASCRTAQAEEPPPDGRTIVMLVVSYLGGKLSIRSSEFDDLVTCISAIPIVARAFPDASHISCISLLNDGSA